MCFRGLAECQTKLNVAFQLSGVKSALASVAGVVELEKSELDRALGEGGVQVEHVVAGVVVMLVASAPGGLAVVPGVCEGCHRLGLLRVQRLEEGRADHLAVVADPAAVKGEGVGEEAFVAGHDVGEVSEGLRGVAVGPDVNVDPAAPGGVALGPGLAQPADQALQEVHVLVAEDRGDHLALFGVRPLDADVPAEFPFAVLRVPGAPGAVAVPVGGVFPAAGAEVLGGELRGVLPGDAVHLNLDPDGLVLHLVDLAFCAFVHGLDLRFVFPFGSVLITLNRRYIKTIRRHIVHNHFA